MRKDLKDGRRRSNNRGHRRPRPRDDGRAHRRPSRGAHSGNAATAAAPCRAFPTVVAVQFTTVPAAGAAASAGVHGTASTPLVVVTTKSGVPAAGGGRRRHVAATVQRILPVTVPVTTRPFPLPEHT